MNVFNTYIYKTSLICLIAGITLLSCKSKKKLSQSSSNTYISIDSILQNLQKPIVFEWYEAKSKIKIESPFVSEKGRLYLRMRKDSAILSAVKKIGYEGGRSLITPDSIFYINRIDHTYQKSSIDIVKTLYGIAPNYNYIESLHAGVLPFINQPIIETEEKDAEIIIQVMINEILHNMIFDRYSGLLKEVQFKDRFNIHGHWKYADYRFLNDTLALPYQREFKVFLGPLDSLKLNLEFSDIKLNNPKKIDFNIPENYNQTY